MRPQEDSGEASGEAPGGTPEIYSFDFGNLMEMSLGISGQKMGTAFLDFGLVWPVCGPFSGPRFWDHGFYFFWVGQEQKNHSGHVHM